MRKIFYKDGYKYQLYKTYSVLLPISGLDKITQNDYLILYPSGMLEIKKSYAWDGASGIAIDTKNFMRGSLVHDALYQLMREGLLARGYRKQADQILRKLVREDGMSRLRSWWVYKAVRMFGKASASAKAKKKVYTNR